jgi:hypothetical protein
VLLELLRKASPARKFQMIDSAIQASRQLALCGLKIRFLNEPFPKLQRRLAGLWLGEDLAEKAYGRLVADELAGD